MGNGRKGCTEDNATVRLLRPQQALPVTLPLLLLLGFTLVVQLLAFGKTNLELDLSLLVVHVQRHKRIAGALGFSDEPLYLLGVQEQFPSSGGIRFDMGGSSQQGTDMTTYEKQLAIPDDDIGFFQLYPPRADRLDLPPLENHPCFVSLLDKIVVKGFLILDDTHLQGEKE